MISDALLRKNFVRNNESHLTPFIQRRLPQTYESINMMYRFCLSVKTLFIATTLVAASLPGSFATTVEASQGDQKINIALYYESQCPGCREMITTSFKEAFEKDGFLDMAAVALVPYGNAQEKGTDADGMYEFECQHGHSECVYNTIEACALDKIECPIMAFQFIDCIERSDESRDPDQDYTKVAMACAKLTEVPDQTMDTIKSCANGPEGNALEHQAAVMTDSLDPPHQFVPYVVVNGEHSDEVQDSISESLFDYVCNAYLGPNKSKDCSTPGLRANKMAARVVSNEEQKVCYRQIEPFATAMDAAMVTEK